MRIDRRVPLASLGVCIVIGCVAALAGDPEPGIPVPSTVDDFHMPGSQPLSLFEEILPFSNCSFCHANFDLNAEPARWRGSLHANAARDPLFQAAVTVANQDTPGAGDACWRCHSPQAWLNGRVVDNPNGYSPPFFQSDLDNGINCNFCHRTVDPVYKDGVSPAIDQTILTALGGDVPVGIHNGNYVMDPSDVRRGPNFYTPEEDQPPHEWLFSPWHQSADMCGTCHNVSNPVLDRQPDGSYQYNDFGTPHPTQNPHDMFPEQRTHFEWANSAFADGPIDLGGRFGGNNPAVSTCQDCHMPDTTGNACNPFFGFPEQTDMPYHSFAGANRWLVDVLEYVYAGELSQEDLDAFALQKTDVEYMLEQATDAEATQTLSDLSVEITNYCGHKLLTGMVEGRRIWINVKFFDDEAELIAERGHYDFENADLTTNDTKVYETKLGIDEYASGVTGLPVGETFHQFLANTIVKDNRIPPIGFTNAGFEGVGAAHVGYSYEDGQNFDITRYQIPEGAASATVTLYYQTASKEYIEFLHDQNVTDDRGDTILDAWENTGKSPPFAMDAITIPLVQFLLADLNGDQVVDSQDLNILLANFGSSDGVTILEGDINADGIVGSTDLNILLAMFGGGA